MLFSSQSPATTNTQRKNSKIPNERRITSDILAETLKGLALHSKINDSAYYNSDGDDAESHPKFNPLVDTHTSDVNKRKVTDTDTTNRNPPQKLLINRTILVIIPPIIPPISDGGVAGRGTAHACQTISSKVIVTDAAHIGAHVFQDPAAVNRKDTDGTIPQDRHTFRSPPRLTSPVLIGGGTSAPQLKQGSRRLAIQAGPLVLWNSVLPNHSTLPLI